MLFARESSIASLLPGVLIPELPIRQGVWLEHGAYVARMALTEQEQNEVFRLRFRIFNLELHEGLMSAYTNGKDQDRYDAVCDHLIVEDRISGMIVGTYRIQQGAVAADNFGYYSEQEFGFTPYEAMRGQIVELGRACIHREHRSPEVLNLLWRGIAQYSLLHRGRYMMGCCSLTSQDPEMGHAVYRSLERHMVEPELRTTPTTDFLMPEAVGAVDVVKVPKLLRAYLTIGAKICGVPAIDREFGTIDFLTLLDLETLHPRVATRFLGR
jgi:putative hemolysin